MTRAVVFLIGARVNSKWRLPHAFVDLGGRRRGIKAMLDHLVAKPDKGLLAYEFGFPTIVRYWRSFEHLEAFAKNADDPPLEVWRDYWRAASAAAGGLGSGTRPISSEPASTRRSTATCRCTGSPRRAGRCRSARPRALAGDSRARLPRRHVCASRARRPRGRFSRVRRPRPAMIRAASGSEREEAS